ncbi:MAG: hypothetical protein COA71_02890 [SAR86 cluster bacterium]|uniref:DUF4156 domain-containing protein n=1 Tax=SAR86 cluster bacterium TaxID=2030880 RepID=A0A2A5CEI9_9GAMM|nr:DUF4156 domain-containing protein [Gammaproteobacteria bacterium AH-315-E17]PCJ41796.1 MAG: hypothetical protein COA71_07230 [SAR86 cluster bacterium]PCJ43827.1 MAG: hypothetical protein COA71_02890 [SAR86 cluster bacterium]
MKHLFFSMTLLTLCSCIWVDLSEDGSNVRVLTQNQLGSSCVQTGTTHVEVLNRVILERAASNILLELQALARNQAAERGDDTVVATTSVVDGEQDYALYRCIPE